MSTKHLSMFPQQITDDCWYYEEPKGLVIMHRIYAHNIYLKTDRIVIPWSKIRKSLNRKDKK
jgi:hypothetical protein